MPDQADCAAETAPFQMPEMNEPTPETALCTAEIAV